MKPLSVPLLLGVSVLLLSALLLTAVRSFSPPSPPMRARAHFVVIIPYLISTFLMVSIHRQIMTGNLQRVSMETTQDVEGAQVLDEDYDDIIADVTNKLEV